MSYVDGICQDDLKLFIVSKDWQSLTNNNQEIYTGNIANVIFEETILIRNHQDKISFSNCYFKKNIVLSGEFKKSISLHECFIDGEINIDVNSKFLSDFHLVLVATASMIFNDSSFKNCYCSFSKVNQIKVNNVKADTIVLCSNKKNQIDKLHINNIEGKLVISEVNVKELNIENIENSNLHLSEIEVSNFFLKEVRNNGFTYRLSGIRANKNSHSEFSIVESNLGNTEFFNIDFSSFTKVNIVTVT